LCILDVSDFVDYGRKYANWVDFDKKNK
jgi:hypothetical protein